MDNIPRGKSEVIGVDPIEHVEARKRCDEEVMGRFGIQNTNAERYMNAAIMNTFF